MKANDIITRVKARLDERQYFINGGTVNVVKNLMPQNVLAFMERSKYKALRLLVSEFDWYVWDAGAANHDQVERELGYSEWSLMHAMLGNIGNSVLYTDEMGSGLSKKDVERIFRRCPIFAKTYFNSDKVMFMNDSYRVVNGPTMLYNYGINESRLIEIIPDPTI